MKKIQETSGKNWESNIINEMLDKFWIRFLGNFDWIILNKIFIQF